MDRQKRNLFTWAFIILVLVAAVLMLTQNLQRSSHIVLPSGTEAQGPEQSGGAVEGENLTLVEITPETVQAAVATLQRPASYRRSVRVEQFWNGGQTSAELYTRVLDGWTRIDRTLPDGQVRHSITDGATTYIWYNEEDVVFTGAAGGISADEEQTIPTYEDLLLYAPSALAAADYREHHGVRCIYTETAPDEDGAVLRYWVSVGSGLLTAAEKDVGGSCVYRMSASEPETDEVSAADFTLPDGRSATAYPPA